MLLICSQYQSSLRARAEGRGGGYAAWALDHWRNGGWDRLASDLVIDTDNRSPHDVAEEIADFLRHS